jgi:quinoprotein dehydrogenase-associated probable ABC transporter substrate-binding protein
MKWKNWGRKVFAVSLLMLSGAVQAEKTFKVCADPNNPPLSQKNGDGYGNKIAEEFAKELGQKLEYTWFPQRLGFIRNTLKMKPEDSQEYLCDVVIEVPQGFEMTATTRPYYRSTYALVYAEKGPLEAIKSPGDIDQLAPEIKSKLRVVMFDGGSPGTTWIVNHGMVGQGVPYQAMTGDASQNTAEVLSKDFKDKKIDMAIVWGPVAGYLVKQSRGDLKLLPMTSEPGIKFDFAMSMGVRIPDKERKDLLNGLIEKKAAEIEAILKSYEIPLLPVTVDVSSKKGS